MSDQTYRVIRGAVKLPRTSTQDFIANPTKDFVMQGELLPPDMFSDKELKSWLAGGRIEEAGVPMEMAEKAVRARVANPFRVDPSTLVRKTMEDMVIMVLEIDPDYDTDLLEGEEDAVRLLTSGWDPKFTQTVSPATDRSRPEALAMHAMEQSAEGGSAIKTSSTELSAQAQAGLEAARAKAAAPKEQSSEGDLSSEPSAPVQESLNAPQE